MGQSEEGEIEVSRRPYVVGTERPLGFCQVGMYVTQNGSGVGMRPEIHQIEPLVAVDQTDEFAPCISRGAKNSGANTHTAPVIIRICVSDVSYQSGVWRPTRESSRTPLLR